MTRCRRWSAFLDRFRRLWICGWVRRALDSAPEHKSSSGLNLQDCGDSTTPSADHTRFGYCPEDVETASASHDRSVTELLRKLRKRSSCANQSHNLPPKFRRVSRSWL